MQFTIFDVETRIDKGLVKAVYFPREEISEEEAYEWNKQTGVCANFDLMTLEEIQTWTGRVIWVPIKEETTYE